MTYLIPIVLGTIFLGTALWNSRYDQLLPAWLHQWGFSPYWRYVLAGLELSTALLLLSGGEATKPGMVLTPAILLASIGVCGAHKAYHRFWLSVPMLIAVLYWWL